MREGSREGVLSLEVVVAAHYVSVLRTGGVSLLLLDGVIKFIQDLKIGFQLIPLQVNKDRNLKP